MTLPDALIERATAVWFDEYHRVFRSGGDVVDHEDAVRSAVTAVVEFAQAREPEWRWEYRVKSGGTICQLGYTNVGHVRDWLCEMSMPFQRMAAIQRRAVSDWERVPDGVAQPEERGREAA